MADISMKEMLEAGAHFGHQKRRWNPKMKSFIFAERGGVHIFDLQQTAIRLSEALEYVKREAAAGKIVLFVGTKKQAQAIVVEEATRAGMPYVSERWIGGMITNWKTVSGRLRKLKGLEDKQAAGEFEHLTKKERARIEEEIGRMRKVLGGIASLSTPPDILFVLDTVQDEIAVKEAKKLGLPVVAVVDSNADPDPIDYVIPANDDAVKAIRIFAKAVADAVIEGKAKSAKGDKPEAASKEPKKETVEVVEDAEVIEAASEKADVEEEADREKEIVAKGEVVGE